MKGCQLREFISQCEQRGLLQVKVSSSLELEKQLELIWESVWETSQEQPSTTSVSQTISGGDIDSYFLDIQTPERTTNRTDDSNLLQSEKTSDDLVTANANFVPNVLHVQSTPIEGNHIHCFSYSAESKRASPALANIQTPYREGIPDQKPGIDLNLSHSCKQEHVCSHTDVNCSDSFEESEAPMMSCNVPSPKLDPNISVFVNKSRHDCSSYLPNIDESSSCCIEQISTHQDNSTSMLSPYSTPAYTSTPELGTLQKYLVDEERLLESHTTSDITQPQTENTTSKRTTSTCTTEWKLNTPERFPAEITSFCSHKISSTDSDDSSVMRDDDGEHCNTVSRCESHCSTDTQSSSHLSSFKESDSSMVYEIKDASSCMSGESTNANVLNTIPASTPSVLDQSHSTTEGQDTDSDDFMPSTCTPTKLENNSLLACSNKSSESKLSTTILSSPPSSTCSTPTDTHSVCQSQSRHSEEAGASDYSLPTCNLSLASHLSDSEDKSNDSCLTDTSFVTARVDLAHTRSCDSHVTVMEDSSDSDSDDKLEKLFSDMKLHSEQKKESVKPAPSRESICEFIVSDSEDVIVVSSDEEDKPCTPAHRQSNTTTYTTPYSPASGIVFWGSPDENHPGVITKEKKSVTSQPRMRRPLVQTDNFFTPSAPIRNSPQPLTTPSSHKYFPRFKTNMLRELSELFNKTVFDNKLLDVDVMWNNKLRTTAGFCKYQGLSTSRTAKIELSAKVCDSFDRLRDTLVHELCHAACWIIDGSKTAGHGPLWKAWADKAVVEHPGLQPVTRCHSYDIAYKYMYKCVRCDFKIGRHSKSVNLQTARCPYCSSELELEPRLKSDGTPAPTRKLNRYAKFLKENYGTVKAASPYRTHAQILEKINEMYHALKDNLP